MEGGRSKVRNEDMETITYNVVIKAQETEEEFIFQTISPFCNNVVNKIVRKKELQEMLLRADRMKWIPCSERIPEEPLELYLVTTKYGSGYQDKVYPCRAFWNGINFTDGWHILDVIAWMPLPELYREVE